MMSRIKPWMKKAALAAAAAASFGGYGCNIFTPEGDAVKADADGVITQAEEQGVISLMKREKLELIMAKDHADNFKGRDIYASRPEGVTDFKGIAQGIVNDVDIMLAREFQERGFDRARMDDGLHIYMPKDMEELKEKYRETTLSEMPENTEAFYAANRTIYVPKGYDFPRFYADFHHEEGHHLRFGAWEYASVANEIYSSLKLYALNRNLGAIVLDNGTCLLPAEKAGSFDKGFLQYYDLGCLSIAVIANMHGGNLEQAWDYVMNAPQLHLDQLVQRLAKYSAADMRHAYLNEFEALLGKAGFRETFRNLDDREFRELSDYLRLRVNHLTAAMDFIEKWDYLKPEIDKIPEGLPLAEYWAKVNEMRRRDGPNIDVSLVNKVEQLAESFLSNPENTNPYFRAMALAYLTGHYDDKSTMIQDENGMYGTELVRFEKIYQNSMSIISLKRNYPCEYDPLSCPRAIAGLQTSHVLAYFRALWYGTLLAGNNIKYDDLISVGEDFVNKFYPDRDFSVIAHDGPLDIAAPGVLSMTAEVLRSAADSSSGIKKRAYCEKAKEFYGYAKQASCETIEDETNREKCINAIGDFSTRSDKAIEELGDCSAFE